MGFDSKIVGSIFSRAKEFIGNRMIFMMNQHTTIDMTFSHCFYRDQRDKNHLSCIFYRIERREIILIFL